MSRGEQDKNAEPVAEPHWGRRLAWFGGLWLAGVVVLGAVGWVLKKLLQLD